MWEYINIKHIHTLYVFTEENKTENILRLQWDFCSLTLLSFFSLSIWPIFPTKVEATEEEAINTRMMCPSSSVFRILAYSRIESKVKVLLIYLTWTFSRLQNVFLVEKSCTERVGSDAHCLIKSLKGYEGWWCLLLVRSLFVILLKIIELYSLYSVMDINNFLNF